MIALNPGLAGLNLFYASQAQAVARGLRSQTNASLSENEITGGDRYRGGVPQRSLNRIKSLHQFFGRS